MSAHVNFFATSSWIFCVHVILLLVLLLVKQNRAFPIVPSSGQWTCNAGRVLTNRTLRAGIHAGEFKGVGPTRDLTHCIRLCCEQPKCDVAFRVTGICFLVTCHNSFLCQPVLSSSNGALHATALPEISYVVHNFPRQNKNFNTLTVFSDRRQNENGKNYRKFSSAPPLLLNSLQAGDQRNHHQISSNKLKLPPQAINRKQKSFVNSHNKTQFFLGGSQNTQTGAKRVNIINSEITKTKLANKEPLYFDKQQHEIKSKHLEVTPKSGVCYPTTIHESVSLKYGPESGDFYDYGNIGEMEKCVDLCCKDGDCDVAFMIGRTCYTTSCYTIEKCQMIPASRTATLRSQLAYVVKKNDLKGSEKLAESKRNEFRFKEAQKKQQHQNKIKLTPSNYGSSENIPRGLITSCHHGNILRDHILMGGSKAGVYKYRGKTPGFEACFGLCCADTFCDAAFLLDRKCYSVQCYKNSKCDSRRIRAKSLHSMLAFVSRDDDDGKDPDKKRADIPGVSPTDRQYTVTLNVTSQEYQDSMSDSESFEFLNFAETFQKIIGDLYGDVNGYKFTDVVSLKPDALMVEFSLISDESVSAKVLLQRMVDTLRKGGLKNRDEPSSPMVTVDVRGFNFKDAKGQSLICHPEHNYNVYWPLAVYKTTVNIPCPRKANGLTSRYCNGDNDKEAFWTRPNFGRCVSDKYEELYKQAQQLNKGKSKGITSASIIDKLSQYTTEDTYGDDPPKKFMGINGLAGKAEEESAKHHIDDNGNPKNPDEVPYASHTENGLLPEAQLRKYIDRMGLSGVLGKTGLPDMMTLYKKLSKGGDGDVSPEVLRKITADVNHGYHQQPHQISKLKSKTHAHALPRPIAIEYDHVTDETSNRDWSNTEEETVKRPIKTSEAYWSPQHPISTDVRIQNPIVPNSDNNNKVSFDQALNTDGITPQTSNLFPSSNVNPHQQTSGSDGDLHWQLYYNQGGKKPPYADTFRRDSFPGNPSGYGYLGDSQESYVDYSQIFPNSLKRKRKRRAVVGDEKELRDFFVANEDTPGVLPSDDDYINVIGTAELEEIPFKGNSPKRMINVKAYPSEIRSPSFSYKFNTTGYVRQNDVAAKRVLSDNKLPTFRLVPEGKAQDFHFLVTKQRSDATNLEELSAVNTDNNNKKKAKVNAESSAKLLDRSTSSMRGRAKVDAEVTVQKCDKRGQCKTVTHPDNNPDTFHSKADSLVMNEHQQSQPLNTVPPIVNIEDDQQQQIEIQSPTSQPSPWLVTKPLPPPPDSELPVDDESDIEPEHARTTVKPHVNKVNKPSSSLYKAQSTIHVEHAGNSNSHLHSVQNILVAETPTDSDSQSKGKTEKNPTVKMSNEVTVKTSNSLVKPLISITVVNKTMVHHHASGGEGSTSSKPKKHPAEIEKIEVEQTPTTTTTVATTPTTTATTVAATPTTTATIETTATTDTTTITTTTVAPTKQPGLFIYDRKIPATESASMLGGDILLVVDITEELLVHAQKQEEAAAIQEVEEFLQASSSVLDEKNIFEWKNTVRYFNHLRDEEENTNDISNSENADRTDWRILHRQKSLEKQDLLLGYVSTISSYGTTVAKKSSEYNPEYKKAIITKNIMMHIQSLSVDSLQYKKNVEFPEYKKDIRLSNWNCAVERIAVSTENFKEKLDPSETIHMTFFRFKTIGEIQRSCTEKEECHMQEPGVDVMDENPVKVDSQVLSVHVEPELPQPIKVPVSFTFANDDMNRVNLPHDCAYWNSTLNDWKDTGCKIVSRNASVTTCQCDHLSIVSVLVNTAGVPISPPKTGTPPQIDYEKNGGSQNVHAGGASINVDKPNEKEGGENEEEASTTSTTKGKGSGESKVAMTPTTTTTTIVAASSTTSTTTKSKGAAVAGKSHQTEKTKSEKKEGIPWWWWLILLLLLLLLLLLCCLICCCYWGPCRRKKKDEKSGEEELSSASATTTGANSHNLVDKSKPPTEHPHQGLVTPGTTSVSESPEPIDAPGWRKLRSHAHHPEELLMREKAMLFKDYIQPYNFASSEVKPPETSRESLFGSTNASSANPNNFNSTTASESPRFLQKYNYRLPPVKQKNIVPMHVQPVSSVPSSMLSADGSTESSPETIHREPQQQSGNPYSRYPSNKNMPNNLTQPSSMDWDPFIDAKNNGNNKRGARGIPRRRKIVSPISEGNEDESSGKQGNSLEAIDGSMFPEASPDISETSSYVDSAPSTYKTASSPQSTFRSTTTGSGDEYSSSSASEGGSRSLDVGSYSSPRSRTITPTNTDTTMTGWNSKMTSDNENDGDRT